MVQAQLAVLEEPGQGLFRDPFAVGNIEGFETNQRALNVSQNLVINGKVAQVETLEIGCVISDSTQIGSLHTAAIGKIQIK